MADWALVPCPGRRVGELHRLLYDLHHPRVCVVTTEPDPVRQTELGVPPVQLIHLGSEVHYGKWLNAGMDHIRSIDAQARYVFITGSDTRANADTIPALIRGAQQCGFVMCGPDHWNMGTVTLDPHKARLLHYRVPPEYFLLDMRTGIRFDEQFRWWYSDDDLEMQARQRGAVGLISGVYVSQEEKHTMSPMVAAWAREDRTKFVQKWGHEPW